MTEDRTVLDFRVQVEADLVRFETWDEGILGIGRHTGRSLAIDELPDSELYGLAVTLYDEAVRGQAEAMASAGFEEDVIPIRSRPEVVERLGAIPRDATDEERRAIVDGVIAEFGPEEVRMYDWDLLRAALKARASAEGR